MKFKSGRKFLAVTFLVMLGWLVALILPPSAQAAGPWYVSNNGDDTNDCTSDLTACASINAVLNKPGFIAGDTVLVATGIYTGTGNEVVFINKGVTLSGGWDNTFLTQSGMSTIDGETVRQGIIITGSISVSLNRLVIQNGFGSESGGGIFNNGGDLTIGNSSLIKNQGSSSGGGLYQISGTLDMSKTLITQNSSGSDGAGIYDSGNNMNITDSIISENASAYGYGGGVANYFGTLVLNNTTISNNIQTVVFDLFTVPEFTMLEVHLF